MRRRTAKAPSRRDAALQALVHLDGASPLATEDIVHRLYDEVDPASPREYHHGSTSLGQTSSSPTFKTQLTRFDRA